MGGLIRERAYPYYRKHADSSLYTLQDGDAFDSGQAVDIDSNIGHLQYEGCRHLVSSLGGTRQSFATQLLSFVGYDDVPAPMFDGSYAGISEYQSILWGPNTCYRFGPFDMIADRVVMTGAGAGRAVLRPVVFRIDLWSAATDFIRTSFIAALTHSASRETLFGGDYLAIDSSIILTPGRQTKTFTLTPNIPVTPAMESHWNCRDVSTVAGVMVSEIESTVIEGYLWFGVLFLNGTNQSCYVNSMCAWETRDGTE